MNDRQILRPGLVLAWDVEVGDVIRIGNYFATITDSTQMGEVGDPTYFRFDTKEGGSSRHYSDEWVEVWTP